MKSTFHRALSAATVAGALVLTGGGLAVAASALQAKPLRAEVIVDSPAQQLLAKPLRAE
jgi:hypothetical protein